MTTYVIQSTGVRRVELQRPTRDPGTMKVWVGQNRTGGRVDCRLLFGCVDTATDVWRVAKQRRAAGEPGSITQLAMLEVDRRRRLAGDAA